MAQLAWGIACGRGYLMVNEYIVAMEGDVCRDEMFKLTEFEKECHFWALEDFQRICDEDQN